MKSESYEYNFEGHTFKSEKFEETFKQACSTKRPLSSKSFGMFYENQMKHYKKDYPRQKFIKRTIKIIVTDTQES